MGSVKKVYIFIVIAIGLTLGVVVFLTRPPVQQPVSLTGSVQSPTASAVSTIPDPRETQRINSLEQRLDTVANNVNTLIAMMQAKKSGGKGDTNADKENSLPEAPVNASNVQSKPMSPEEMAAQGSRDESHFDSIEDKFYSQEVNPAWQANEEQKLQNLLSQEGLNKVTLNSLECRSNSCRLDTGQTNKEEANEFLETLSKTLGNSHGEFKFEPQADGTMRTVVIVSSD